MFSRSAISLLLCAVGDKDKHLALPAGELGKGRLLAAANHELIKGVASHVLAKVRFAIIH